MKWVCWKIKGVDVRRNPSLIPGTRTLTSLDGPVAPFTPGFCGAVAPGPSGIFWFISILCSISHRRIRGWQREGLPKGSQRSGGN
jgi:hypothetical protein